jgi:hypothetical protein
MFTLILRARGPARNAATAKPAPTGRRAHPATPGVTSVEGAAEAGTWPGIGRPDGADDAPESCAGSPFVLTISMQH